jgi:hypothetical protein
MLRVVVEPMLHREIAVAMLHPLDSKSREDLQWKHADDSEPPSIHPNLNRRAIQILLRAGGRLSVMASVFLLGISTTALKLSFLDRSEDIRDQNDMTDANVDVNGGHGQQIDKKTYSRIFVLLSKLLQEWNGFVNNKQASDVTGGPEQSNLLPMTRAMSVTGSYDESKYSFGSASPTRMLLMTPSQRRLVEESEDKEENEESGMNLVAQFVMESEGEEVKFRPMQDSSNTSALSAQLEDMMKENQAVLADIVVEDESLIRGKMSKIRIEVNEEDAKEEFDEMQHLSMKTLLWIDDACRNATTALSPLADSIFHELSRGVSDHPTVLVQVGSSSICFCFDLILHLPTDDGLWDIFSRPATA